MIEIEVRNEYFEWMLDMMCRNRYEKVSFRKLLTFLHDTEFVYSIRRDRNRASDGVKLRRRFGLSIGYDDIDDLLEGPCSVLEMMIALAIRCEDFMDDDTKGDRTGQWFWQMVVNLGLGGMTDDRFDRRYAQNTVDRFLDRDYEPDGRGGLFRIRNCDRDLRDVEIWYQLCWYLDSID